MKAFGPQTGPWAGWSHDLLVQLTVRWAQTTHGCSVVIPEPRSLRVPEQPDVIGWKSGWKSRDGLRAGASIVFECKRALSDFRRDAKKPWRDPSWRNPHGEGPLGQVRWFLAPAGVIPVAEVPEGWGLAEVPMGEPPKVDGRWRVRVHRRKEAPVPTSLDPAAMQSELLLLMSVVQSQAKRLKIDMNVIECEPEDLFAFDVYP